MAIVIRQKHGSFCSCILDSLRCAKVLFFCPKTENGRGVDWDMLKHYA